MAFETFDLGKVIATAEGIKQMRRQSTFDTLREQATRQGLEQGAAQEQRAQAQFQTEMDERTAREHYFLNHAIESADDPIAAVDQFAPEVRKQFDQTYGEGAFNNLAPEQVRKIAGYAKTQAAAKAGIGLQQGPPEDVVQTVGPDGQPVYTRKSQAPGQRAYVKPESAPGSYEEFVRAQKDPAFANFLKQRKGKGLSVTMPDGTVIEMGGEGGKVDAGDLSKPTINNLQDVIVKSTDRLDRLNATLSTYNPDFLRAKGIASAATTKAKDFLGLGVSDEQRKYLDEYSQFTSSAATDLTQFLKDMSGAAVTPQEYARTEKALPSGKELSPVEFEAKTKVAVKTISRAIMRANWALKNGIGVKSVDQLAKVMPLESIDQVYEERANQIWQELGGTPETKAQAIQKANQEFGLAR